MSLKGKIGVSTMIREKIYYLMHTTCNLKVYKTRFIMITRNALEVSQNKLYKSLQLSLKQ